METWVEELPKKKFFSRVNTTECLVTISMLVSNRIDTVEKCFESFRPLLEQIPSEFIALIRLVMKNQMDQLTLQENMPIRSFILNGVTTLRRQECRP